MNHDTAIIFLCYFIGCGFFFKSICDIYEIWKCRHRNMIKTFLFIYFNYRINLWDKKFVFFLCRRYLLDISIFLAFFVWKHSALKWRCSLVRLDHPIVLYSLRNLSFELKAQRNSALYFNFMLNITNIQTTYSSGVWFIWSISHSFSSASPHW